MEQSKVSQEFHSRTKKLIDEVAVPIAEDSLNIPGEWEQFSVFISVTPNWSTTYAGQLMLMSSVNLIGRFCNNLYLENSLSATDSRVVFPFGSGGNLLETCSEIARNVNPTIMVKVVPSRPESSIALGIGTNADIVIASDNWFSYLNCPVTPPHSQDSLNPFGPLFASCLGATEVFRKLLSRLGAKGPIANRILTNIRFSTLDYSCNDMMAINPPFPEVIDVGKVLFAGSGAVANGAAAAMYFIDKLTGSVAFLDDQNIDLSNIGRYYLTTLADVGQQKVHNLVRMFRNRKLSVNPLLKSVESLTATEIENYDAVVSALDNRNHHSGRIHLQNLLPNKIIHAATQGMAVAVASIDFLDGICLGCLFSLREEEITTAPDVICGGVTIRIEDKNDIAAAVSFVSAASGILAASELIKRNVPELHSFVLRNYLSMSLMSPDLADVRYRQKDSNCLCLCSEPTRHAAYRTKYTTKKN